MLEDLEQGPAVHVAAGGQVVEGEHRRGHVEQAGAEDQFVGADARPGGHENPERPVLGGRAGRFVGQITGPEMVGVEAVVAHEHHGHVLAGEFEHDAEHRVVKDVRPADHLGIEGEILLRDHSSRGG